MVCCADQEGSDVDLDRDFLQGLRELKFLSEKEVVDEHKAYVTANINCSSDARIVCDMKRFALSSYLINRAVK